MIYDRDFDQPYTHVRVLACRVSPVEPPEILEICRTEIVVGDDNISIDAPRTLLLSSVADEGESGLPTATPKLKAQTIWTPGPPDILVGYSDTLWESFPEPFTRGIARVSLLSIARLLWPTAPTEDPGELVSHLGIEPGLAFIPRSDPETSLQLDIRRTTIILMFIYIEWGALLAELRGKTVGAQPWISDVLGQLAPDLALQALVELAALPQTTGATIPGVDAPDDAWQALSTSELISIATSAAVPRWQQFRADAELGRRARQTRSCRATGIILRRTGRPLRT